TRSGLPSGWLHQRPVDAAAETGAAGIVVHGGHVLAADDQAVGFDNWRKCVAGLDAKVPVLIENTAGGNRAMARGVERLAQLWAAVLAADGGAEIGFCLDTCHFY